MSPDGDLCSGIGSKSSLSDLVQQVLPILSMHAAEVDERACFPEASVAALRHSGLFGLLVPAEYGGLGGGLANLLGSAELLASACLSTSMIWAMHCQQVDSIVRFGSQQLRRELLPRIARGEVYLASVTTEPRSGGSLLRVHAPLLEGDDSIVVERDAPVVTGGGNAEGFLVTMRDSSGASKSDVTLVYVDRSQAQIEESAGWNPLGMRGTHSIGIRLRGKVPTHQIVGGRGEYRRVALESMVPLAHLTWAACWLGAARSALADVVSLIRSSQRPASLDPGSPLVAERLARARSDLELISAYLGAVRDEVMDHWSTNRSLDTPSAQIHINTLKVMAAEHTYRAVDSLVQLTGLATGYLRESPIPLERHLRDLRSASLNHSNDRLLVANGAMLLLDRAVRLLGTRRTCTDGGERS